MVPPDSYGISGVPHYLGAIREPVIYDYGGVTLCAASFAYVSSSSLVSYSLLGRQLQLDGPTTPYRQRLSAITPARFSLFRVRSPLLTESLLFSLPVGTEMFHFPTFPPLPYVFRQRCTGCPVHRFPHSETPGSQLG